MDVGAEASGPTQKTSPMTGRSRLTIVVDSKTIGTIVACTALQSATFRSIMGLLNVGVQWVTAMTLFSRISGFSNYSSGGDWAVFTLGLIRRWP